MQPIAHIKEIWRYPVKSLGGELIDQAILTSSGLAGDRAWAVVDSDGGIKSARQWPKLLEMKASYAENIDIREQVYAAAVPHVGINIPGQASVDSGSQEVNNTLEQFLGKPCRLEALRPPTETDFYTPPKKRNPHDLIKELDKLDDEGEFDFSQTPEEIFEILGQYMTPPGTFFDSFPLHMLSAQSLHHLGQNSEADANRLRFRPNLLLDFTDQNLEKPEFGLVGKCICIGDAKIRIRAKTIRCSIPKRPQPLHGLSLDPNMTRAMVNLFERHIGVYANIEQTGEIHIGDPVFVVR